MGRKIKACVSCHERKVRCDTVTVGIPCSRCTENGRTQSCTLLSAGVTRQPCSKSTVPEHGIKKRRQERPQSSLSVSPNIYKIDGSISNNDCYSVWPVASSNSGTGSTFSSGPFIEPPTPSSLPLDTSAANMGIPLENQSPQVPPAPKMFHFIHERPNLLGSESPTAYDDTLAYHDGTNSITILNEVFGSSTPKQLTRNDVQCEGLFLKQQSALEADDADFLRRKGAFTVPPEDSLQVHPIHRDMPLFLTDFRDALLGLFFRNVYLCVPIIDRVRFIQEYRNHTVSIFLLQAILACSIPHVSRKLLEQMGFADYPTAQKVFFTRAKFLHDFDVEKNPLHLLQGSLLLSTTHVSHCMQRDHRFWLSNAAYVAAKMGLHHNITRQAPDIPTKKLFRRIWWVLYTWDALLALNGMDTMRRFRDAEFHTPPLTEADWEEEIPLACQEILCPVSSVDKSYMIESCKLSIIIGKFWHSYAHTPLDICYRELDCALSSWRRMLPASLQVLNKTEWNTLSSWNLNLITRSYICECIMFRMIFRSPSADQNTKESSGQKLRSALFEANSTIDRIMNQSTDHFNTWLFHTCISTALALNIERTFAPTATSLEMSLSKLRIESMLEYLRDMAKSWPYITTIVGMFERVIGSTVTPSTHPRKMFAGPPCDVNFSLVLESNPGNANGESLGIVSTEDSLPNYFNFNPFNPNSLLDEVFHDSLQNLDFLDVPSNK